MRAARAAAAYCVEKPYYGRDQQLAKGWLVVLDALDQGKDPGAALDAYARSFVEQSNNGVPRTVLDGIT